MWCFLFSEKEWDRGLLGGEGLGLLSSPLHQWNNKNGLGPGSVHSESLQSLLRYANMHTCSKTYSALDIWYHKFWEGLEGRRRERGGVSSLCCVFIAVLKESQEVQPTVMHQSRWLVPAPTAINADTPETYSGTFQSQGGWDRVSIPSTVTKRRIWVLWLKLYSLISD